jgi:transposase-like protein
MKRSGRGDMEKERYWRGVISKAARSGLSIRAFCAEEGVSTGQFYIWRRKLKAGRQAKRSGARRSGGPTFALVSDGAEGEPAGIELVLSGGRRLRISKGVDRETLTEVVAILERERC